MGCCDLNERKECTISKLEGDTKLREAVDALEARAAVLRSINVLKRLAVNSFRANGS